MHCIGNCLVQRVIADIDGRFQYLELPDPVAQIWPGLSWGRFEEPLTPAFWASQAWMATPKRDTDYRLGASLVEEVVFCLLGGHGTPAEVGLAASRRVSAALSCRSSATIPQFDLEILLREPLIVRGRPVRYRFAAQRARYLSATLSRLTELNEEELDDIGLRDALCAFPGIGPKTASWIVRNRRASDRVAILDIHIVRACAIMGVLAEHGDRARRYYDLERRFLRFCAATGSRASAMDAIMWATMRRLSRAFLQQFVDPSRQFAQVGGRNKGRKPDVRV
jgi:thermostable 8-oxoguanine DNA glycosylase